MSPVPLMVSSMRLPVAVLAAAVVAWVACGLLRRAAVAGGWLSAASEERAGPGRVPLLGGLGVLTGLAAGWPAAIGAGGSGAWGWAALLAGYAGVGLWDDRASPPPALRLAIEAALAAAAVALLASQAPVAGALATLALVAGANALNLADNADGLAAGTGLLTLVGCGTILAARGATAPPGALAAAWTGGGALAGFLLWNRPPARIYLGDAGALPLGALVALLLLAAIEAGAASPWGTMPCVAGYLLVDPLYAVSGRLVRRAPPWRGGVDHLSHHLRAVAGSWLRAWGWILAVQAFSVASGIAVAQRLLPEAALIAPLAPWAALWAAGRRGSRHATGCRRLR